MQKIMKRKYDSMTEDELETLESLLSFLKTMDVLSDHHVVCRRYHDTVTAYHRRGAALSVDSQWCSLYEVEGIIIVDESGHWQP